MVGNDGLNTGIIDDKKGFREDTRLSNSRLEILTPSRSPLGAPVLWWVFCPDSPALHPLVHMGVLGNGQNVRRAVVRDNGIILANWDDPNGFHVNTKWQLRNGSWEDL